VACREIGNLLPNNRRQRRTCYALCHILYPVSAALTSIFRMDSNSTSYCGGLHAVEPAAARNTLGVVPCSPVFRKEAGPLCRTSSSVRLWWEFKEPKGPKGPCGTAARKLAIPGSFQEHHGFSTGSHTCKPPPRRFCLVDARSTEPPGVRLWWARIKPKGPKGPRAD